LTEWLIRRKTLLKKRKRKIRRHRVIVIAMMSLVRSPALLHHPKRSSGPHPPLKRGTLQKNTQSARLRQNRLTKGSGDQMRVIRGVRLESDHPHLAGVRIQSHLWTASLRGVTAGGTGRLDHPHPRDVPSNGQKLHPGGTLTCLRLHQEAGSPVAGRAGRRRVPRSPGKGKPQPPAALPQPQAAAAVTVIVQRRKLHPSRVESLRLRLLPTASGATVLALVLLPATSASGHLTALRLAPVSPLVTDHLLVGTGTETAGLRGEEVVNVMRAPETERGPGKTGTPVETAGRPGEALLLETGR